MGKTDGTCTLYKTYTHNLYVHQTPYTCTCTYYIYMYMYTDHPSSTYVHQNMWSSWESNPDSFITSQLLLPLSY